MKPILIILAVFASFQVNAQKGLPSLPTSSSMGLQGSVGAGFVDYNVNVPNQDLRIDRGIFAAGSLERAFNVMNLYVTLSLSNMTAEGLSNYSYTNLSSSTTYTATDVKFKSNITDLGFGIKLKLIDDYWFRPYIEGGALGGYHQVSYTSKRDVLDAQGGDYKAKDVVLGSGYYGEAGIEVMFSAKFGVKLAARQSKYQTKKMETFANRGLQFTTETYFVSMLFGM